MRFRQIFFQLFWHLGILLLMKNKKAGSKKPANAPKAKNADYPIKWKISVPLPLAKTRRERPLVGSEQCNSPDSRHREKTLYVCSLPSHRGQLPAMADFGPGGSRRFNCILALTVPVARGFYPIPFTPPPDLKTRSLQQTATPDKRTLFTFYLLI